MTSIKSKVHVNHHQHSLTHSLIISHPRKQARLLSARNRTRRVWFEEAALYPLGRRRARWYKYAAGVPTAMLRTHVCIISARVDVHIYDNRMDQGMATPNTLTPYRNRSPH